MSFAGEPGISCVGWLESPLIPGVVSELVPLDEPRGHALVQRGRELLRLGLGLGLGLGKG